nr:retrovirus-related Pol polyprotein from transposon TNT 1-94 [Tanacetum cinerariifolium]
IINPYFKKIDSPFQQTSSLKPYVLNVILENIIIDLEDDVVSLLEKEKENLKTIGSLKSNGFESSENAIFESKNQSENDCHVVEKECDKVEISKIIDSRCSKHMTGNRALLTNFVEKFLRTVCFGNNDFAVIAGYGDVVIGSMTIKKVYYVEGFGHNLFSVGQFCYKGLEVAFRKSTCFVRNEDRVDLLTGDRSSNLYTIALNEVASNSSNCLLAKASSSRSWLWHQRLSHLNFATINNLVKNNLVQGLPKMKFEKDHLCSVCEQGKIHRKQHKSKTAFASNKPLYLLDMDLCGPMRVESINEKRYVLVVVDDYSRYIWVFFLHSKDEASEVIISFIKKTQVNFQLQVQRVQTNNGTEFKNETLSKFFDEINFEDDYFQEIINPYFKKIDSPFQQTSSLKPYVPNVILENIVIDLEDDVVSLLEKEKENLKTIESLKSNGFESSENAISESKNQCENDCHVVEKECDKVEISKVIALGLFKLSVSQSVSPISMSKTSCESNHVENLDTFSSFRRPKNSSVI